MQFTGLVVDLLLQTIPQKFVQRLTGKITGTIKLESRAGSSFDVQVINNQGKVSLGFGWEAFVSSHDLNRGDFLVFKYNRRSHLKVLIRSGHSVFRWSSVRVFRSCKNSVLSN